MSSYSINVNFAAIPPTENKKFETNFDEIWELGHGSSGNVFRVIHKQTKEIFAIKKIICDLKSKEKFEQKCINSVSASTFDCENLVSYHDVWLEKNFLAKDCNDQIPLKHNDTLFIQMEYCEHTLREIIERIREDPILKPNKLLSQEGLKIMDEISIQILQGVNYLHNQKNPIMHRDLKDHNILVNIKQRNNKKHYEVKIADFDLIKICYVDKSNAQNLDLDDLKSDIYSLGVILKELYYIEMEE
jgi:serine/threonine protein kinase